MAFCKKKTEKLWLWRAYDPIARRTIAWVLGRRDDATCKHLLNKIGVDGKTFVTYDWAGYHRLIPENQLFTGNDLTVPIEQDNSNIRHFLARFRRRTKGGLQGRGNGGFVAEDLPPLPRQSRRLRSKSRCFQVYLWLGISGVRLVEETAANRHKFTDPANRLSYVFRSFDSLVNNLHSKG